MLDYNPVSKTFFMSVSRSSKQMVNRLMREHGLDFSLSASTAKEAVLFTKEPYAACAFAGDATAQAKLILVPLITEINASWKGESNAHIKVPYDKELWPFQRAGVEYALRRRNTLFGDQPGLGKTEMAIAYCNEVGAARVLVVCPASIRRQWYERIQEWSTMERPFYVHSIYHSRNGVHPEAEWTIVSYDLSHAGHGGEDFIKPEKAAIWAALSKGKYDVIILDEIHYLKTVDSKRTRAIFGGGRNPLVSHLAGRAQSIIGLSGTPLPNRPREAYTIARALCWDSIDYLSEEGFRDRFNPSVQRDVETVDRGTGIKIFKKFIDERSGRHAELQARLRANFMTRHLKREVLPQLAMPVYDLIQCDVTGAVKQALEAESLLEIDPENLEGADITVLGHIAAARRLMGIALAPQVADWVSMLINGGEEKLVIFSWHIEVMNILQERLSKYGLVRIDGSTSANQKSFRVKQFIEDKSIQVILGNILSMGVGTDGLQKVSCHALIAEPSWVPGENIQCFDRLDRGGQKLAVQGDIFVAPGSIAEKVLATALRKGRVIHSALDRRDVEGNLSFGIDKEHTND